MRISDWSSDVCSSDLEEQEQLAALAPLIRPAGTFSRKREKGFLIRRCVPLAPRPGPAQRAGRSGMREPMARKQHAFTPQAGEGLKSPTRGGRDDWPAARRRGRAVRPGPGAPACAAGSAAPATRSEEHTSELQSIKSNSY